MLALDNTLHGLCAVREPRGTAHTCTLPMLRKPAARRDQTSPAVYSLEACVQACVLSRLAELHLLVLAGILLPCAGAVTAVS